MLGKTPKNDKINKQEYTFYSYFVSVIDIDMIKKKNIGRLRYIDRFDI